MDYVINGLPIHVLLVHVVVIVVPVAALCLMLSAFWPAARRRLGIVTALVALVPLIAVPITIAAGQWLQARVVNTPLVERHVALGPTMQPWAIAVFVVATVQWLWYYLRPQPARRGERNASGRLGVRGMAPVVLEVVLDIAVLVVAAGSVITVVLIGESGSAAVWTGLFR